MSVILNDRDVLLQAAILRNVDPSAGKALLLQADTNVFHVAVGGAGSPESIMLRAQPLNIPGAATFSVSAGGELAGTGNTRSLVFSSMTVAQVTITAQIVYGGITYSAQQIIAKVFDGATGADGDKTATAYLYQWAMSTPAEPTGASTYTWATGVNSAYSVSDGWAVEVPGNPGTPGLQLFTAAKPLTVAASTVTSAVAYAGAAIACAAMNGATGLKGAPGIKSATARAYQWALSAPTATGSATWTWATASYNTAPATGWSMTKPAAPGQGYTLYEAAVQLVDGTGTTTSVLDWSTAARAGIGYVGFDGNTGAAGSSMKIGYSLVNGAALALSPATVTTTGTAYPALVAGVGPWGETSAWQASSPAPAAGQTVFQLVGIYDGVHTVWGVPYLSNLKVGSLSALSANLGSITAGDVHGAAFHAGAFTAWAWPASGNGFYLGPNGLLLGNGSTGPYFQVAANGDVYSQNFSIASGAVTMIGATVKTSTTGERITMNEGGNKKLILYGDAGGAGIEALLTLGIDSSRTGALLSVGSYTSTNPLEGIRGFSNSNIGVHGRSSTGIGVYAESGSNYGALLMSSTGMGAYVSSSGHVGLQAIGTGAGHSGVSGTCSDGIGVFGGGGTYDFYAGGVGVNYGPFTGGHDGLVLRDAVFSPGDLLVDVSIVRRSGLSNTIAENALSSSPMQKNAIGVFVLERPLDSTSPPAALADPTMFLEIAGPPREGNPCAEFDDIAAVYKRIAFNALGEGQINVCGEGGNLEAGDYITTSSTPGKGMRQADGLLHNYTVAKAREAMTFSDPSEIRMIACTYHCG